DRVRTLDFPASPVVEANFRDAVAVRWGRAGREKAVEPAASADEGAEGATFRQGVDHEVVKALVHVHPNLPLAAKNELGAVETIPDLVAEEFPGVDIQAGRDAEAVLER